MQLRTSYDNSPDDSVADQRKQRIWFLALALGLGLGIMVTGGQPQPAPQPNLQPDTHHAGNIISGRIDAQIPRHFAN